MELGLRTSSPEGPGDVLIARYLRFTVGGIYPVKTRALSAGYTPRDPARLQAATVRPGSVAVSFSASAPGRHLFVLWVYSLSVASLLVSRGVIDGRTRHRSLVEYLNIRAFVSTPPLPSPLLRAQVYQKIY